MDKNKIALSSLAMDLRRAAMGYYRGSSKMADRFLQEAGKRKMEIDTTLIKPYLKGLISKLDDICKEEDDKQKAEDALMYSILFQNAALAG
jgi:hypothetical protein